MSFHNSDSENQLQPAAAGCALELGIQVGNEKRSCYHTTQGMEMSTEEVFETLVGTLDLDGNLERSCVLAAAREQLGMPPSTRRLRANLLEVMARRA